MKIINGGITQPKGFQANGIACGIKKSGKPDLSLIFSNVPCVAAAVYTKNSVKAAPLIVTKKHLMNGTAQAIIANSGNANCFTGQNGLLTAMAMANETAKQLKIKSTDVLVASTGIIGKPLPIAKIKTGLPELINGLEHTTAKGTDAAKAIMTTDLMVKQIAVQFKIGKKDVTIAGCAKGSGMIEPNMATMFCFLTTDAAIEKRLLKKALIFSTDLSFNCITVDGCMSTNDMVSIMANGLAENELIKTEGSAFKDFCAALTYVCLDLAKKIVKDGEGAKKLLQITVDGAKTEKVARMAAKAIANSNLVKTAAYGKNANWGRIAAAVGSLGINITENDLVIKSKELVSKDIFIHVNIGKGHHSATILTCDLTEDYIKINGAYN
jgi:glutamate N-acetyltransferase/amino-acid N-acetyltransferase